MKEKMEFTSGLKRFFLTFIFKTGCFCLFSRNTSRIVNSSGGNINVSLGSFNVSLGSLLCRPEVDYASREFIMPPTDYF